MRWTTSLARSLLIDAHSHIYTPRLVELLRKRSPSAPCITPGNDEREEVLHISSSASQNSRLTERGGIPFWASQFTEASSKLSFMDRHRIDASVVSIAEPWLDFLSPDQAVETARVINDELEAWCQTPSSSDGGDSQDMPTASVFSAGDARTAFRAAVSSANRLRALGVLPFAREPVPVTALTSELEAIQRSTNLRGAVLSTNGLGKGLGDERLEPLWECAERLNQALFLHPRGADTTGSPASLAFEIPFETATAAAQLVMSGVLDRHPDLRIIVAHGGGALPVLSSRLALCISQAPEVNKRLKHDVRFYLGQLYYDAVCYGPEELESAVRLIGRARRYRRGGPGMYATPKPGSHEEREEIRAGAARFLFGTDHPFFPPRPSESSESSAEAPIWQSASLNLHTLSAVASFTAHERDLVAGTNASALFDL